jgi:hypothetical protein
MILRLLQGREMVSGLFEKKRDAIPPHPTPPQALHITRIDMPSQKFLLYSVGSLVRLALTGHLAFSVQFNISPLCCPSLLVTLFPVFFKVFCIHMYIVDGQF